MGDFVEHAPLLLGLRLCNTNNNDGNRPNPQPSPATLVPKKQVVEAAYLKISSSRCENDPSSKAGIIRLLATQEQPLQGLTAAQCDSYNKNGYLVLPDVLTHNEAIDYLKEVHSVMRNIATGGEGIILHDMSSKTNNASPIGRVLATFEGGETSPFESFKRPIARLGCGIHQLMPSFNTLKHSKFHRSIAASLNYTDPRVAQSQLIAKLAGSGSGIVAHQDGCVSFTNPPSGLTFWYALEDTEVANGCLCVARGSHLAEPVRQKLVKGANGEPILETLDSPLWARGAKASEMSVAGLVEHEYEYVLLEVKRGSLVLFHENLMHRSERNRSEKGRMAYSFSVVDGALECPDDCYMKPVGGGFDLL